MGTVTLTTSPLVDMLMEHKDQRGMSDRELAEAIGVSHGSPSNWRRGGKVDLDLGKIQRIAKMLDIEDWKVPVLAYGLDGPGLDTDSLVGDSPRSPQWATNATYDGAIPITSGRKRLAEVVELPGITAELDAA